MLECFIKILIKDQIAVFQKVGRKMKLKRLAVAIVVLSTALWPTNVYASPMISDDAPFIEGEVDPTDPVIQSWEFEELLLQNNSPKTAKATCRGPYAGMGFAGVWTTYQWINCSLAGSVGYQKTYTWEVINISNSKACSQGMGYNSDKKVIWRTLGCGSQGHAKVPWGNVLSIPKYKTTSISAPFVAPTQWN